MADDNDFRISSTELGITLVRKTRASTNPNRHFHLSWELLYLISGTRTFFYANRTITMRAGDIICIGPGVLHRALNINNEQCDLINLYFDDTGTNLFSMIQPVLADWSSQERPVIQVPFNEQKRITNVFISMYGEMKEQSPYFVPMVSSDLMGMLVELLRQSPGENLLKPAGEISREIIEIIEYVNSNFRKTLTLRSLARSFLFSGSYISRIFTRYTHYTFIEYLNTLRVREACRLLSSTDFHVTVIAENCGFGSVTQFGRWFRKITGSAPLAYRKKYSGPGPAG